MILLSACLCGVNCKYNGGNNTYPFLLDMSKNDDVLLVCPEEKGGLSTPRKPCEIVGGTGAEVLEGTARVINSDQMDVTENFVAGAYKVLDLARANQVDLAVLQDRSPSCGAGRIYDGNFNGQLIDGDGVTAALLRRSGIKVVTATDYLQQKGV
jgi:uncharacterized protein YbbK (DUF523 family)